MPHDSDWASTAVLLLKTESKPVDDYRAHFTSLTRHDFVPVLEHVYHPENMAWLRKAIVDSTFTHCHDYESLTSKDRQLYSGLIFTSQRAVEAFAHVVASLNSADRDNLLPRDLPLYVVGPATARTLVSLGLKCSVLGEESGTGANLADYILANHPRSSSAAGPRCHPLLFLVGEQRRDIIPKTLQSAELPHSMQIAVTEKVMYESRAMNSMRSDLAKRIQSAVDAKLKRIWLVVFSPTGCKDILRHLRDRADIAFGIAAASDRPVVLIVTIGPTTRDYLSRECGFQAHACADEPSPGGIDRAIRTYGAP